MLALADFYHFIDQYGLTTTKLFIAVVVISLLMLFAVREIFAWFMKTSKIARQFNQISKRLEHIEAQLSLMSSTMEQETEASPEVVAAAKKMFEINH